MIPDCAYFVKVNVALVLFYAIYRLLFYEDTFFKLRRVVLLLFLGVSLLYPFLDMQDWMQGQVSITKIAEVYTAFSSEVTVDFVSHEGEFNWQQLFFSGITYLYGAGVIFLSLRFLIQLGGVLNLVYRSKVTYVQSVRVYLLNHLSEPFSFFHYIFLNPEEHSEKEVKEILVHEGTHVQQWHSIDVLLSEWMCIFCWINPFVWLLKREVRYNLEYLADDAVLKSGFNSKCYQYHLLGMACADERRMHLSNSFSMLHLKNRIRMMNKARTQGVKCVSYLLLVPVVALLLLLSNVDTLAHLSGKLIDEASNSQALFERRTDQLMQLFVVPKRTMDKNRKEYVSEIPIFTVVQKMPEFPGGVKALVRYLAENVKYPEGAVVGGAEGRVTCTFIVRANGYISNVEILRGIDPLLDAEAVRVLRTMPRWSPGMQRGIAVDVKYTVPITFRHPKNIKKRNILARK